MIVDGAVLTPILRKKKLNLDVLGYSANAWLQGKLFSSGLAKPTCSHSCPHGITGR